MYFQIRTEWLRGEPPVGAVSAAFVFLDGSGRGWKMLSQGPWRVPAVHFIDGPHGCHCLSVVKELNVCGWNANHVGCFVLDDTKFLSVVRASGGYSITLQGVRR